MMFYQFQSGSALVLYGLFMSHARIIISSAPMNKTIP